jgi:hypothetical protein
VQDEKYQVFISFQSTVSLSWQNDICLLLITEVLESDLSVCLSLIAPNGTYCYQNNPYQLVI